MGDSEDPYALNRILMGNSKLLKWERSSLSLAFCYKIRRFHVINRIYKLPSILPYKDMFPNIF